MSEVPVAKLRRLVFNFYQDNDPVALQGGIDVNGIVNFAVENGVQALNDMLSRKYGKGIDISEETGDARENFNRMSIGLSMSARVVQTEHKYREQLFHYFQKHDPDMASKAREQQFEKFVKFAMLNGMEKLSEKLKQRYGAGVEESAGASPAADNYGDDREEFVMKGQNQFGIDTNRLRDDLEMFYTEMDDVEQLDVLDETIDWACQLGMDEFNLKLEQLYGTTLNNFLKSRGRQVHEDKGAAKSSPPPPANDNYYDQGDVDEEATQYEEREELEEYVIGEREFNEMTDDEIVAELTEFYSEHDMDNLEKLPQVLQLCRSITRQEVNDMLVNIYGVALNPIAVTKTRTVTKRVAIPKKPKQPRNLPTPPRPDGSEVESGWGDDEPAQAPPRQLPAQPTFNPPPQMTDVTQPRQPVGAFNPMDIQSAGPLKQSKQMTYYEEPVKKQPEWLQRQQQMKKRIMDGKALVRDGRGGTIEVNLLIDICKKYNLDLLTGICKCGFAKKDHSYLSRH